MFTKYVRNPTLSELNWIISLSLFWYAHYPNVIATQVIFHIFNFKDCSI